MTTAYECTKCKKLYKDSRLASKCCKSSYTTKYVEDDDSLLDTILTTLAVESIIDSISDIGSSISDSFSGGGGDFGGGGSSGDW